MKKYLNQTYGGSAGYGKMAALLTSIMLIAAYGKSPIENHLLTVNQGNPPEPLSVARPVCKIGLKTVLEWPGGNTVEPQKIGVYTPDEEVFEVGQESERTDRPETQTSVDDFILSRDHYFFLDSACPSIKCYNVEGKLVWVVDTSVRNIYFLGAHGDTLFVVMSNVPQEARAFDKNGEVKNYNQILLSQLSAHLEQAIHLKDISWIGIDYLGRLHCTVEHSDQVDWIRLDAKSGHYIDKTTIPQMIAHQRFMVNKHDGNLYVFDRIENGVAVGTRYMDTDGQVILENRERTLVKFKVGRLSPNGTFSHLTYLPESELSDIESSHVGYSNIEMDGNGNFYRLAKSSIQRFSQMGDIGVRSYEIVLQYSPEGRYEGVRAIMKRGPDNSKAFCVDQDGNVFYLNFHSDLLSIMKAPKPR